MSLGTINLMPLVEPPPTFMTIWNHMMTRECHEHTIWESAFVKSLRCGSTHPEEAFHVAAVWAVNMVVGSFCFPAYVAALASRAPADAIRHALLENAWDESGGAVHHSRSHFWLAVRLARLLDLDDNAIANIRPLSTAQAYTDEHYRICSEGDFGEALGMLCLIEEFTTPEFSSVLRGFTSSWMRATNRTLEDFLIRGGAEYFTANIADDERHRNEMPRIAATLLASAGVDVATASSVTRALEVLQSGIRRSINLRASFFREIHAFVVGGRTFHDLI